MAIIKQSIIVLFSIISYSVGLDLFQVSKVDTQAASLNAAFVTFLLLFDKSTQNYTINRIFFFFFFGTMTKLKRLFEIVALGQGAS